MVDPGEQVALQLDSLGGAFLNKLHMLHGIGELIDHIDAVEQDFRRVLKEPEFIEVIKTGSHFTLDRPPSRGVRIIEFPPEAGSRKHDAKRHADTAAAHNPYRCH